MFAFLCVDVVSPKILLNGTKLGTELAVCSELAGTDLAVAFSVTIPTTHQ